MAEMELESLSNMVFAPRVILDYTNHKGVMSRREIIPIRMWYGTSNWHAGEQNFLTAYDIAKDDIRDFAIADIHAWEEAMRSHLPHMMESRRSPQWRRVRQNHIAHFPSCAACGVTKNLEVHHVLPFHVFPEKELDPTNLLTLCETPSHNCHFLFGHCLHWQAYNPNVIEDAARIFASIQSRLGA
jgi:5-methylcytosine-specific restriction protein A